MKYKCIKAECQVCGKVSLIQLFFRCNGKLSYGRARHYVGKKEGKPQFSYHAQAVEVLKTLLKTQPISLTPEHAKVGQMGHNISKLEDDLISHTNSFVQQNSWGCRLAWSRLVDLGSIDSGSNPGSPTNF